MPESQACALCHQRKVKCDRSRPGCRVCPSYGKPCPGYNISPSFTWVYCNNGSTRGRKSQKIAKPQRARNSPVVDRPAPDPWDDFHSRAVKKNAQLRKIVSPADSRSLLRTDSMLDIIQPESPSPSEVTMSSSSTLESGYSTPGTPSTPGPTSLVPYQPSQRIQSYSEFLDLLRTSDQISYHQHPDLVGFPTKDVPSSCVTTAVQALILTGIGSANRNGVMMQHAYKEYGATLRKLQEESRLVIRPERFKSFVTSMLMLRHCELFGAFSKELTRHNWRQHLLGMRRFMAACGPDGLLKDEYDWSLFQAVRFHSLYLDIDQKSPSMFAEPNWLALTADRAQTDPEVALQDLRVQIAGLLAREHKLVTGNVDERLLPKLSGLFQAILNLRAKFTAWMEKFGKMRYQSNWRVGSNEQAIITEYPHSAELFRTCFKFDDFAWASHCTTCWLWTLRLDCAMLTLTNKFPRQAIALNQDQGPIVQHADDLARNLCRSVYWCSQPEVAESPQVGTFHLKHAQNYFEIKGLACEIEWCKALEEVIRSKGRGRDPDKPSVRFAAALCQRPCADRLDNSVWVQAGLSLETFWHTLRSDDALRQTGSLRAYEISAV